MPPQVGYTIADIAALKAIGSSDRANGYSRLARVGTSGKPTWLTFDAGATTGIVPDDNPATGRWIEHGGEASAGSTGGQILTEDKTWYVDATNGSDSNNGLTTSTAFQTLLKAAQVATSYINQGTNYTRTIRLLDGTHGSGFMPPFVSNNSNDIIDIQGNSSNASTVTISGAGDLTFLGSGIYRLSYVTFNGSFFDENCLVVDGGRVILQNVAFGSGGGSHITGKNRAIIEFAGNYDINGNASRHFNLNDFSLLRFLSIGLTIGIGGSVTSIGTFAYLQTNSYLLTRNLTIGANSITGKKYNVIGNSMIDTDTGGNVNYFPGNTAGTLSKNGQYF